MRFDKGVEEPEVRKVLDYTGLYEAWFDEVPKPTHNSIPVVGMRFMDLVDEGRLTTALAASKHPKLTFFLR